MTTSGQSGDPAAGSPAGQQPAAGDQVAQLQQEIEQTREQLGETVGQLAAKADVKAMATSKVTEVSERMKTKADLARQQAASTAANMRSQLAGKADQAKQQAGAVRGQLAGKTATVRQRAQSAGQSGKSQIVAAGAPVWDAAPEPVRQAVAKGAGTAKERRVPIALTVVALVLGLILVREWANR